MDYSTIIPRNNPIKTVVDAAALRSAIERVSVMLDNDPARSHIRCALGTGNIEMTVQTALGCSRSGCPMAGDGGGMEIGFNGRYLLDATRNARAENLLLEMSEALGPCVIRPKDGDDYLAMVLPIRMASSIGASGL